MTKNQETSQNYNLEACDQTEELRGLRENYIKRHIDNEESLCIRVIRKKFKFIMLLLLIMYLSLEIVQLALTNAYNGNHANTIFMKYCAKVTNTTHATPSFKSLEYDNN